jgi:hypothetical protein
LTSLDGYDLSSVVVKQNNKPITFTLSADHKSISFNTVEDSMSIICGLYPGRYELKETVTPEAYLTAEAIVFELLPDGSADCGNGNVIVKGSPIVMVDKADPTYVISSSRTPIPATGEEISIYTVFGIIALLFALSLTGYGVYQFKKKKD